MIRGPGFLVLYLGGCRTTYFTTYLLCLQIIFEGITGSSYTGDIAIDEVKVTEGRCPGKNTFTY